MADRFSLKLSRRSVVHAAVAVASSCVGVAGSGSPDGGATDSGQPDAGTEFDAGQLGSADAATGDAGNDAGSGDAGARDAGAGDAGQRDAGPADAGAGDADAGTGQLPSPGQVVLIGSPLNTAISADVRPMTIDTRLGGASVQMSEADFSYATMEAFGSGTFMPDVGAKGSWVMVGGGGHGAPPVFDPLIFDFATARWRTETNAQGVPNYASTQNADSTKTTGAPDYEVANQPGGVHIPWPSQMYCHATGYGSKVIFPFRSYIGAWTPAGVGYTSSLSSHFYDVASRQYGRIVSVPGGVAQSYPNSDLGAETTALLDPVLERVWIIRTEMGNTGSISYLDLKTWAWGSVTPAANVLPATGYTYLHALLHDDGVGHRCLFLFNDGYPTKNWVLDLDRIDAGWAQVNTVGTLGFSASRWAQYPSDRCHYCFRGVGQKLSKITPPPYPFTGNWVFSELSHGGADLPQLVDLNGNNGKHYTRFMYVPALDCFAWVAGGSAQVALWKP